jgi:hypothetical protein
MAQFVVAKFDTASAADAAAQDLEAAMIPSAVSRRHPSGAVHQDPTSATECTVLTVAVDEVHSGAVVGILNLYGTAEVR